MAHSIDCVCSKMLNHGLNHGLFLSLFKLIPCPIHWIVCVSLFKWVVAVVQLFQQISQEAFRKGCFCIWIGYSIIWKYTFTLSWKKCLWKNAYINVFIISNCMSHLFLATDFAFNSWLEKRSWSYWDLNCTVCIWHWYSMVVKIQVMKPWYFCWNIVLTYYEKKLF